MAKHSIPDSLQFVGEWFLPSESEGRATSGTLTWSSQRASLQLHDSFNPLHGVTYDDDAHSYPAIHGTTIDSKLITVLDASRAGTNLSFGPAGMRQPERMISSWVVVGAHVDAQTRYCEIRARIPGLEIWLSRSGVKQTLRNKTDDTSTAVIYEVEGLREEISEISSISAILGWGIDGNFSGNLVSDISVKISACVRIHSMEPKELSWFFHQLGKATTLLSLIAGSPMSPDHISAKISDSDISTEILVALREAKYCTYRSGSDFYMRRGDMEADLSAVFSRWFELYERIAMPSQLALSILSSEGLWLHVEFLSFMQALEGFHRATMPGLYASEEEYELIRKKLSDAIPTDVDPHHREALKSRIKYGNEISLRKRLDALVGRLALPLRKRILGEDGKVPRSWIDTRNYYTHWDENSRESVLDGIEMHRASVRMKHLLRALYLDLVGISHTAIEKSLSNACRDSQYLIQLNNVENRKKEPSGTVGAIMSVDVKDTASPDGSAA